MIVKLTPFHSLFSFPPKYISDKVFVFLNHWAMPFEALNFVTCLVLLRDYYTHVICVVTLLDFY